MFIVTKNESGIQTVLKIHLEDRESLDKWLDEYFDKEIESLSLCPAQKDTKLISYKKVNQNGTFYQLIKEFKKIYRGYVYNSSEWINEIIYEINIIECDDSIYTNELNSTRKSDLWFSYNSDVNLCVIKQLDRESLYNVINHFLQLTEQKPKRISEECISMISESLRIIKRELYNTTIKRVKRMGRITNNKKND